MIKTRDTGHPLDVEDLVARFDFCRRRRDAFGDLRADRMEDRRTGFFASHLENSFDLARLSYLFGDPLVQVLKYAGERLEEIKTIVALGHVFVPTDFRMALLVSIFVDDNSACEIMCSLPDQAFRNPNVDVSECGYLLLEAIQALGRKDDKSAADKIARARSLCNDQDLIVNPRSEKALYQPFLGLCEALLSRDSQAFTKAAAARQKWWKKKYGKKSESANNAGILDLELLGLMRLAQRRGMELPAGNLYAPLELLEIETGG